MHFSEPQYLYLLLLLIPLAALLQWGNYCRRKSQRIYAEVRLLKPLKPETSTLNRFLRNGLTLLSLLFIVLALARPQLVEPKEVPLDEKGSECIFVVDLSNSMLAEDFRPNRLGFVKLTILRLLNNFGANRVGIVVFAGSAFTHLPITGDLATAKNFISECTPAMISNQGTAIGSAIQRAFEGFSSRSDVGKAIILFTDGENHDGDAVKVAEEVAKKGVNIFTVAVGSTEGALIPLENDYLMDADGSAVLSKANPDFCQAIANAGNGIAFFENNVTPLSKHILDEIKKLPQVSMSGTLDDHEELYGQFLIFAAIFLVISTFIPFRKNRLFSRLKLFDR